MTSYVVMEPPAGAQRRGEALLLRDGFSWLAFLVPPLWLLWHRLWIEALLAAMLLFAVSAAGEALGLGEAWALAGVPVSLWFGLEGQALRISALRRRGWREWGVVQADDRDDADLRYALEATAAPAQGEAALRIVPDAAHARSVALGLVLGLPPQPGRT